MILCWLNLSQAQTPLSVGRCDFECTLICWHYARFYFLFGTDEKEDSILGSILLPSFHISMLSVDDHISRKYAFKVTHKAFFKVSSIRLFWQLPRLEWLFQEQDRIGGKRRIEWVVPACFIFKIWSGSFVVWSNRTSQEIIWFLARFQKLNSICWVWTLFRK